MCIYYTCVRKRLVCSFKLYFLISYFVCLETTNVLYVMQVNVCLVE